MNRLAFLIATALFLASTASAQDGWTGFDLNSISRKWMDVPYAEQSPAQKLDVYLPEEGDGPFPVIVYIHGGAFKGGDKRFGVGPMLRGLRRGYAVVAINYRLSGEAKWPAQINDVKAAIRWARANAEKYKLDPGRLAVWGGSAGGHLSALAGTSGGVAELEDPEQGNADQSTQVQAVVDWFGPIDFLTMDEQFAASGIRGQKHNTPRSPESELFGKPIMDVPELVRQASPATYISPDDPPFYIQHGTVDPLIPVEQSARFAEALRKELGEESVVYEPLEGTGHGGPQFLAPVNVDKVLDFLDKYLK